MVTLEDLSIEGWIDPDGTPVLIHERNFTINYVKLFFVICWSQFFELVFF